jgi:hypothetical protein
MIKIKRKFAVLASVAGALAVIGTGTAVAATASSTPPAATRGCVETGSRTLTGVYENPGSFPGCKDGFAVSLSGAGTQGPAGPQGKTGPAGPQGPSGVTAATASQLVTPGTPVTVPTGGSFSARAVTAGTVQLAAGTYLLSVSAEVTPDATTGGAVYPQLMVYDGPVNADFTNDLFNVGNGPLENPTATELTDGDVINGYLSASQTIVVPAGGETLDVYAFGYDSDQGEGSYLLNSAVIDATQITPAPAS